MHEAHAASPGDGGAPSSDPPPLSALRMEPERIRRQLATLPAWHLREEGDAIYRVFPFPSLEAANSFAHLAFDFGYEAKHYPVLTLVNWMVVCQLTTLEAGGVTGRDFEVARMVSLID